MKKRIGIVLLMATCFSFAQKKTNGTIYVEHPAIKAVEEMTQARVSGDATKVASYLASDFKYYSGTNPNETLEGKDKDAFATENKWMSDNVEYYSISRAQGAYPDALEYKENKMVWVQTWENIKGVDKKTGVKINMPVHCLYTLDKDNKIKTMIVYSTNRIQDEIAQSSMDRKNGVIYNHHDNINTVRKMIYCFEFKDFEKGYSYYDEKATFQDINSLDINTKYTLAEYKANDKELYKNFDLESIVQIGYPDYLNYELESNGVVLSWWKFNLIRKSDKKAITVPMHLSHTFNKEGKIILETAYYNAKLLEVK
jgi:hypothetical protein